MMTVRFPSGFSIQYNAATFAQRMTHGYTDLYTKEGGAWIAQVPTVACVIENTPPCRTYNPIATYSDEAKAEIAALRKEVRALARKIGELSHD